MTTKAPSLYDAVAAFLGPLAADYARIIDEGPDDMPVTVSLDGYPHETSAPRSPPSPDHVPHDLGSINRRDDAQSVHQMPHQAVVHHCPALALSTAVSVSTTAPL